MKQILTFALIILFCIKASAQTPAAPKVVVKGLVVDSTNNQPQPFVTVIIKVSGAAAPIKSTLTKDNGSFELSAPVGKVYQLSIAYLGYRAKTINLPTAVDGMIDVKKILLSPATGQLKEVTITEAKPMIKQEVDRIAYDVQADPESKEVSALDMMRKVPLITVGANDAIQLKGSGNYKILINGKESALMATNPSDVLKSMPATNIQKIEVITTPPAKYDAEGLAGIINIITKKNTDQGYNIGLNGRLNNVYGPGININGTLKEGKFGLTGYFGFFGQGTQTAPSNSYETFLANQSVLTQNGSSTRKGHGQYQEVDLSYEIDTLNLITGSIDLFNGFNNLSGNQFSQQSNSDGSISQQYMLNNSGYNNYEGLDADLNYELGFKHKKDELLTLSYKYSYSPNKQYTDNLFSDSIRLGQPSYQQYNNSGNKSHTIQLDYSNPFGKALTVEAGGKAILRNNFSDFESQNLNAITNEYVDNVSQTNDFNYHQDVYGFYNSYQLKLDKWTAKAGLRVEHTQINADFTSVGSSLDEAYSNIIPSISAQRSFKSSSITLGFTERIQRPGIYQLNPFVNESNPKFISTGNPGLKPELSHTFELNYSNFAKSAINVGLSYAFSNNSIQNVTNTEIQNIGNHQVDTVTISTYQNLGSNKSLGLNVNTNYNFTKAFSLSLNGQIRSVWLKGTYNGQFYTNQGYIGNAFGNMGYKFDDGFRLGFNAGYFSGNVNLQGKNGYNLYTSFLISKEMLNKKLTLSLVSNNPWSKYFDYKSTTSTPDFYQESNNQYVYRTFAIRYNYKFGRLDSDIKKNKKGINNDDTQGGTKSGGN